MASDPRDPALPETASSTPGPQERSWRGLTVGLAIGIAVVLVMIVVFVATRGSDDSTPNAPAGNTTSTRGQVTSTTSTATPESGTGPATTRKPTPVSIVASDDRRVVVLDQTGNSAPRTLFDLGESVSSDQSPPLIGGVALSDDAKQVYFDVIGTPVGGTVRKVPVDGGAASELGDGLSPSPSPDGSTLAVISAPEPDVPAALVLRNPSSGSERRIDLGDGTCGNVAWAPSRKEIAVDICAGGEPITVAIVDVASTTVRQLNPPAGVTWSVPSFKPDGTLTVVEQRGPDAVVVALAPDRATVTASILRRTSTTITTIDWSKGGDLLVCDADGIVIAAIGGGQAQQITTGYTAAAW